MSASEKELIRVEDLHKSFGSLQVLKGVTEHVNHGEVVSVIGPSGGGKDLFRGNRYYRQKCGYQPSSSEDGNGIPAL